MKTIFVIVYIMGMLLENGDVEMKSNYLLKDRRGKQTLVFSSREDCEYEIRKIAKSSAGYFGKNQKLVYQWDTQDLELRRTETNGQFDTMRCAEFISEEN